MSADSYPLVSIVTVCFNSAGTIRDTIESVLEQDYPAIEYIIVDGGSSDGTLEIVDEYRARITWVISEPDQGIYDAMNKGIRAAGGEYVALLNSDDVYADTGAVSRLVARLRETAADCVFADLVVVSPRNTRRIVRHYYSGDFDPGWLRYGWMPAHPTFVVRRALYEQHGGYSLDYRIASDFEMMVRLFWKAEISWSYLPSVVVRMRGGGVSSSGLASRWALNREIVRACRANGLRTNLPLVLLKIPAKLLEYLPWRFRSPAGRA